MIKSINSLTNNSLTYNHIIKSFLERTQIGKQVA